MYMSRVSYTVRTCSLQVFAAGDIIIVRQIYVCTYAQGAEQGEQWGHVATQKY